MFLLIFAAGMMNLLSEGNASWDLREGWRILSFEFYIAIIER
jgi:hypothetical protein